MMVATTAGWGGMTTAARRGETAIAAREAQNVVSLKENRGFKHISYKKQCLKKNGEEGGNVFKDRCFKKQGRNLES